MPRDRLSTLSDSLLLHILSLLRTKKAVMTCVLSKRWRFLWTDLSEFTFYDFSSKIENIRKLVDFVNRTLVLCNGELAKRFEIGFNYANCFASAVNAWIEFAVKYRVKNIALTLLYSSKDTYIMPQIMYSHSSLEMLSLRNCIITPRGRVEWGSLKHLYLKKVELHQPVITEILSGCPVLCSLYLEACSGFDRLEVNSQSLMSLTVNENEFFLEISAPSIHCLEISACSKQRFRLKNISSLVEASIDFDMDLDAINYVWKLFVSLQHVKNLNLGARCIKVILVIYVGPYAVGSSYTLFVDVSFMTLMILSDSFDEIGFLAEVLSMLAKNGLLLPIPKQDCLTLNLLMNKPSIPHIHRLLGLFPDLETLVIKRSYLSYQDGEGHDLYACDLKCDLLHLKSVDVEMFEESYIGGPMLKLVQLLLKKAIVLEKMVIKVKFRGISSTPHSSGYIKIAEMLLSYPRSSPKAVVVLVDD
ncbi:hypothetical protein BUALT_Bualt12G0013500 [Buddleja alternifolia]|uniref:At1g61320/AtMIF1 LRR domain-containing protein n=1 Tax=Buddleja alternifolia TaxID=168488 RepID=A0AAV6WYE0_9LAMI|nr:hypothetical protein BUALT_Bualt12G0013500 [Buddleja alternifolia]